MKTRLTKLVIPGLVALLFLPLISALLLFVRPEYTVWKGFVFVAAFSLVGWIFGSFLPVKTRGVWHIVLDILVPLLAALAMLLFTDMQVWIVCLMGAVAIVMTIITDRKCCEPLEDALTTSLVVTCIGMYPLAYAIRFVVLLAMADELFIPDIGDPLVPFGIVALFGGIYLLNWIFTVRMANTNGGTRVPASLRTSNIVMTTVLALVMVIAATFTKIRDAVASFFRMIGHWIAQLFDRIFVSETSSTVEEALEHSDEMNMDMLGAEGTTWNDGIMQLMKIIAIAVSVIVVCWLLFIVFRAFGRFLKRLYQRIREWIENWQKKQKSEEYEDEQEDNFTWDRVREDARKTMRKITRPFRKVRLEQLPDDTARVRQVYTWILQKLEKKGQYVPSETPSETGEKHLPNGENEKAFIDAYNRARFSEHPVTPEEVQAGRELLRKI